MVDRETSSQGIAPCVPAIQIGVVGHIASYLVVQVEELVELTSRQRRRTVKAVKATRIDAYLCNRSPWLCH